MGWRVVVVSSVAKLDYRMGYLVIRTKEEMKRIFIPEILTLVMESTAVSMTAYLLSKLSEEHVSIIFCNEKRNPQGMYMSLYGSHDTSRKVRQQIGWKKATKERVWQRVVFHKIQGQAEVLRNASKTNAVDKLNLYLSQITPGDTTNREGHAAKVYFNALFGMSFTREDKENVRNAQLIYGYAILLSYVAREIVVNGYITQVGIFHDNVFNDLNLASDLMEPFRPFIDVIVSQLADKEFTRDDKHMLVSFLNHKVIISKKEQYVSNAITIYVKSILDALSSGYVEGIQFPEYELSIYESNSVL